MFRAHNPEVTGSKPVAAMVLFFCIFFFLLLSDTDSQVFALTRSQFATTEKQLGAVEARRAHNPEVTGSKPVAAIGTSFFALPCDVFVIGA
ncbi:hypothetical protein LB507_003266 [Fusarium sp. FIESC RH6]|nr:hypothetical protein LB507_003266 [Fusarium sp. FIESC RH6]